MQEFVNPSKKPFTDTSLVSVTKGENFTVKADCLEDGLEIMTSPRQADQSPSAMVSERERLRTFQNVWPLWAKAKPADLAKHGFYYTNEGDRVRCAFCGLEIEKWTREMADDVFLTHWKSAHAYCGFLKGASVGNLSIQDDEVNSQRRSEDIEELRRVLTRTLPAANRNRMAENYHGAVPSGRDEIIVDTQALAALNSSRPQNSQSSRTRPQRNHRGDHTSNNREWTDLVRTAQYPHMASLQARLATFSRWPLVKPSPREMAKAGLFCATSPRARTTRGEAWSWPQTAVCADSVKCFWCGEKLHRWRSTDDAVLEHARLSPHCRFVRQLLGEALHQDVISSNPETLSRPPDVIQPTVTTTSTLTTEEHVHGQDDVMNTPAVRTVLQMGFPPQLIRTILGHNSPLLDAETLCNLALQAAHAQSLSRTSDDDLLEQTFPGVIRCQGREVSTPGNKPTTQTRGLTNHSEDITRQVRRAEKCHGHSSQGQGQAVEEVLREMGKKYSTTRHLTSQINPASTHQENVRTSGGGGEGRLMCKLCQEQEVKVTFRPCGHLVCCLDCSQHLTICPVCQRPFTDKIITYLA